MALLQTPTPMQAPETHVSMVWRRIWSVVLGAASVGLLVLTSAAVYNVAKTYGSIFAGGWPALWVMSLGIAYAMGSVAVMLWSPPGTRGLGRRALIVMAATVVTVFIVMWFVGPLY